MEQELLGFPLWLRINHFINLFCIFVLMRSGVQILADAREASEPCGVGGQFLCESDRWVGGSAAGERHRVRWVKGSSSEGHARGGGHRQRENGSEDASSPRLRCGEDPLKDVWVEAKVFTILVETRQQKLGTLLGSNTF